ncbi:MAG: hypothetical protein Q7S40_28630 [Opitutaceae bacterium]|nr:hypothetical protein [Opitutaceae bacterium]
MFSDVLRCGEWVDSARLSPMFRRMTATQVIRQLEKLPARERRKVFAYVDSALERREEAADRKAITEVRKDTRPSVPWSEVKARIGVA